MELQLSHSCGVSLVWDHTVLPANRHKWTHPAWTPARRAGTDCICNQTSRSTQPSTLCGMVKWVSGFGLSNNKWQWCSFVADVCTFTDFIFLLNVILLIFVYRSDARAAVSTPAACVPVAPGNRPVVRQLFAPLWVCCTFYHVLFLVFSCLPVWTITTEFLNFYFSIGC